MPALTLNVEKPLVSVILPTYNRADWLRVAIESVLEQTYTNFELLILDNASFDHTEEVVSHFVDPRIKYIRHRCNIGLVANWSYGVYLSRGKYLSILCDDDFYEPDFLSSRIDVLQEECDIQAVFSSYYLCDEREKITATSRMSFNKDIFLTGKALMVCVVRNEWFLGATLFSRDIVLKYWEDALRAGKALDTALKIRIALDPKNKVAWIKQCNLVNRCHFDQESVKGGRGLLLSHITAFNEPLNFVNTRYRLLLKRGAARAYGTLRKQSWHAGERKVAFQCFLRQLSAFPYLPWLYAALSCIRKIKRHQL